MAARVLRESDLEERVACAIRSHMGPWYDGPEPESSLEELVHTADMVASTSTITPKVPAPIPGVLEIANVEETEL